MNNTQSPNMASAYNSSRCNPPTNLSVGCNSLKTFQTPNMGYAQKAIRTNLSSLHTSLRVAQILSVTAGYSQMEKDSVQAVLMQRYTNYPDYIGLAQRLPNSIGSVQRLPDDIGLVPVILFVNVERDLNQVNIIYSVDCLILRCLRLISPFTAVTINCALLSPSSKFFSKSATTSCGKRAFSCCDLLLVELVAITESPCGWCDSVYAKINIIKGLMCDSLRGKFKCIGAIHHMATPRSATHTIEASNHNVNWSNTMAMYKSTQTHPKFKWRFFSCQQSRYFTVEARSEQEARSMLPDAPCLFSARFRQSLQNTAGVSA